MSVVQKRSLLIKLLKIQGYLRGMMRLENLNILFIKFLYLTIFTMQSPLILRFNFFLKIYCYRGFTYTFQCNLYTLRPQLLCEDCNSHSNNEDVIYCYEVNEQFQTSESWQQDQPVPAMQGEKKSESRSVWKNSPFYEKNKRNIKRNIKVGGLPWELQKFSLVLAYGEALKSNVRSITTMKFIWHYDSYGLFELSFLKDLIKRKAFRGFTFSIAQYFLWISNKELDQSPKVFEYYIVSLVPKAKTSFISPSKAATEFSFRSKWCAPRNPFSVSDASPVL